MNVPTHARWSLAGALIVAVFGNQLCAAGERTSRLAPAARFEELVTLTGMMCVSDGNGWSPTDSLLLVTDPTGLRVWDAHTPHVAPRFLLAGPIQRAKWSKDGRWVAAVVRPVDRFEKWEIWVVDTRSTRPPRRLPVGDTRNCVWADANTLYCWPDIAHPGAGALFRVTEGGVARAGRTRPFFTMIQGRSAELSLVRLSVSKTVGIEPIAVTNARGHRFLRDTSTDGQKVLVSVPYGENGGQSRSAVISPTGSVLAYLGYGCGSPADADSLPYFQAATISGDGRLVAGFQEHDGEDTILSSPIFIASSDGAWVTPLGGAGDSTDPQLSRVGSLLAYDEEVASSGLHIGRVILEH